MTQIVKICNLTEFSKLTECDVNGHAEEFYGILSFFHTWSPGFATYLEIKGDYFTQVKGDDPKEYITFDEWFLLYNLGKK